MDEKVLFMRPTRTVKIAQKYVLKCARDTKTLAQPKFL